MCSSTRYHTSRPTAHRRRVSVVLAAERRETYDPDPVDPAGPRVTPPGPDDAPFGRPVLAELPALTATLQRLSDADTAMLEAVAGLADLLDDEQVAHTSGVGLEHWVGIVARHTRMDRRFLLRTARQLTRYPTLRTAVDTRAVSWPQLRGLSIALREVPPQLTDRTDRLIGQLVEHLDPDSDPDAIIVQLRQTLATWKADLQPAPAQIPSGNRLTLQPNLEGTGGTGWLDLDPVGLALLDEATHPRTNQLDHPGGLAAARADNLLAHLTGSHARNTEDAPGSDDDGEGPDEEQLNGNTGGDREPWLQTLTPPKLLLRAELSTLLDTDRLPTQLLTRLIGGSVRLTTDAARKLVDTHGVELRTIILDQGRVVGVGRATRQPPGWLTDTIAALHTTCTGPLCDRPARGAQLDHAQPWTPTHPDQPSGTTDVDNLGPLCAKTNRAKETAGWQTTQTPDGRRRWHHPRTGLTTTTIPTTWRPPDPQPPDPEPPDPSGSDPPGADPG